MLGRETEQDKGKSLGSGCIFRVIKEGLAEKVMFEQRCLTENTLTQILYLTSCQQPPNLFI